LAKKKTFAPGDLSADTRKVYDVLNSGTDLACVLVAMAWLDESLRSLLHQSFVDCEESEFLLERVVSGLWAPCVMAYSTGLIDRTTFEDLDMIRKIRNDFAHSHFEASFHDRSIQEMTRSLKTWTSPSDGDPVYEAQLTGDGQRNNARARFGINAAYIGQAILFTARNTVHAEERQPYA
jgi:DNA-binding MltR family transcriptional regulator